MRRFLWFDCLRCFAVFIVVAMHGPGFKIDSTTGLEQAIGYLQLTGWIGVDLFFVLSGFLVSGLLFEEYERSNRIDGKRFLIRRALKIVPGLYVLIFITIIVQLVSTGALDWSKLSHEVFFLQSFRNGIWGPNRPLAVEVHFYILLTLLMVLLARKHQAQEVAWAKLPVILVGVLVVELITRLIFCHLNQKFNYHSMLSRTTMRLDGLAAGVLLRYAYQFYPHVLSIFQRGKVAWLGAILLLLYPAHFIWLPHSWYVTALIPTFNYVAFAILLVLAIQLPFPKSTVVLGVIRPFDFLGKHSYSIYLWNWPTKIWLAEPLFGTKATLPTFALYFISVVFVGTFMSMILEMPVLHLRERLFPSRVKGAGTTESALLPTS